MIETILRSSQPSDIYQFFERDTARLFIHAGKSCELIGIILRLSNI